MQYNNGYRKEHARQQEINFHSHFPHRGTSREMVMSCEQRSHVYKMKQMAFLFASYEQCGEKNQYEEQRFTTVSYVET